MMRNWRFYGVFLLTLCLLSSLICCNQYGSTSPTRVADQELIEQTPTQVGFARHLDFINLTSKSLYYFTSVNRDGKNIETDIFQNTVQSLPVINSSVSEAEATVQQWKVPLWSNGAITWWKNSIPFGSEKESLWTQEETYRQDQYALLPGSFVMDIRHHCMCFLENEEEFVFLQIQADGKAIEMKIPNDFSFVSTKTTRLTNYRPASLYGFSAGYLLVVSCDYYYNNPYRYLFYPLAEGHLEQGIEISTPNITDHVWSPAASDFESNTFVLLDHTDIIHTNEAGFLQQSNTESPSSSDLMLIDLLKPESPLPIKLDTPLVTAVYLLNHPEGVQLFAIPEDLQNIAIQSPIWIRKSNSLRTQNPLYIPLPGNLQGDVHVSSLSEDSNSWVLFACGLEGTHEGWIVTCTALEKQLKIKKYHLLYDTDFVITNLASLQGKIYFSYLPKGDYFQYSAENTERVISLEWISELASQERTQ